MGPAVNWNECAVIVPANLDVVRDKGIAVILAEGTPRPVALAMPRFTAKSAMDLTGTLAPAGMPTAFAPMVREVTVDRPFVFVITDTTTGAPVFLGRIADPTAT